MSKSKLDYSAISGRDFSLYYLSRNPFPDIPIPEEEPEFVADRDSVIDKVYDVTTDAIRTGNSSTLLLLGINGSGKSHILKYIKNRINLQLTKLNQKGIAVYIQNPGNSILDFYNSTIEQLGRSLLEDVIYKYIAIYLSDITTKKELEKYVIDKNKIDIYIDKIIEAKNYNATILKSYLTNDIKIYALLSDIIKNLKPKNVDFYWGIFGLTVEKYSYLSWQWLTNNKLSVQDRENIRVSKNFEEDEFALDALYDLKMLMNKCNYKSIYYLLDEAEDITDLHHITQGNYIQALRHLIDNNPTGICLIICITPSAWSLLRSAGPALSRRLMMRSEWLQPFTDEDFYELIELYLNKPRDEYIKLNSKSKTEIIKTIKSNYSNMDYELYPFSKEVLNYINKKSEGLVSTLITYCKRLLDDGLRNNIIYDSIQQLPFYDEEKNNE